MATNPDTAVSTAVDPKGEIPAAHKTLTSEKKPSSESENRKLRKPKRERGIRTEHGKYAASAGIDPITKKPHRKHGFDTYEEAREWRSKQLAKKMSDKAERRQLVRELAEHEAVAAVRALDALHAKGFIGTEYLTKACDEWIRRHPQATPTTVSQFYDTWISLKKMRNRRTRTVSSATSSFKKFLLSYGHLPLTDVEIGHIESVVFDEMVPNPNTRRGRGIVVQNFFHEAAVRGLIGNLPSDNPCHALVLPDKPEPSPDPWRVDEYRMLLQYAWDTEDHYHATAYIAIGGLAGLRTEELHRIRFERDGVDIDRGFIRVPTSAAKKKRARNIEMDPGLRHLLIALRNRPRIRNKHVRPLPRPTDLGSRIYSPKLLAQFKQMLIEPIDAGGAGFPVLDVGGQSYVGKSGKLTVSGPSAWRDNGLRAAYATYDYERGKDAKGTAAKMGHTGSLDVFYNHYFTLAQPGEGEAFYRIASEVLATGNGGK